MRDALVCGIEGSFPPDVPVHHGAAAVRIGDRVYNAVFQRPLVTIQAWALACEEGNATALPHFPIYGDESREPLYALAVRTATPERELLYWCEAGPPRHSASGVDIWLFRSLEKFEVWAAPVAMRLVQRWRLARNRQVGRLAVVLDHRTANEVYAIPKSAPA